MVVRTGTGPGFPHSTEDPDARAPPQMTLLSRPAGFTSKTDIGVMFAKGQ